MKKSAVKFLAGAIAGAGLAVAVAKYLNSEEGKKFKDFIYKKLKTVKNMTNTKYKQAIIAGAIEYGKVKKMSDEMVKQLIGKTLSMWEDYMDKEDAREK